MASPPLPLRNALIQPSLVLDIAALGTRPDQLGVARAMRLAERVAAGDERDSLFVVHRHALERLADVAGRRQRIGLAVGAFRVHVDQAHLHGGERVLEQPIAAVALVAEPLVFIAQ